MRTGMTLGKFAPLHKGHQLVIETALAEMDRLKVIIYDSLEVTHVPLAVRANWIRTLYPAVKIIEAWDGPAEVGYSCEIKRLHERYILEELGVAGISHFYSSEPYGEHMSKALGAVDRRVDTHRLQVPISATKIRNAPYEHRAFLEPLVYRDLIVNIAFLGGPSTGKTTLCERLAERFGTRWMPEYGREYWEQHQVNRRLGTAELIRIAETHLSREDQLLQDADRYLFTDTTALTTAIFCRYYHGFVPKRLQQLAETAAIRYDLTFLCDTDIPYDDTWDRSGEGQRAAFQCQTIQALHHYNTPYIVLSGDLEKRIAAVESVLAKYQKYKNLHSWTREIGYNQ